MVGYVHDIVASGIIDAMPAIVQRLHLIAMHMPCRRSVASQEIREMFKEQINPFYDGFDLDIYALTAHRIDRRLPDSSMSGSTSVLLKTEEMKI